MYAKLSSSPASQQSILGFFEGKEEALFLAFKQNQMLFKSPHRYLAISSKMPFQIFPVLITNDSFYGIFFCSQLSI